MIELIDCGGFDLNCNQPHSPPVLLPSTRMCFDLDYRHMRRTEIHNAHIVPLRLAIHLHVYYVELLPVLLRRLKMCQPGLGRFDLWISTNTPQKQSWIHGETKQMRYLCEGGDVYIRVVPNLGRNVGPLLMYLWQELSEYDLLLHLHGKRSVDSKIGDQWMADLLRMLLPNSESVLNIRDAFSACSKLGLLIPQPSPVIRPHCNWGTNFSLCSELLDKLGVKLSPFSILAFPAGMMFWCRPIALKYLHEMSKTVGILPNEPLPIDGTYLHALERLVVHSCELMNLEWRTLCDLPPNYNPVERTSLRLLDTSLSEYGLAISRLAESYRAQYYELAHLRSGVLPRTSINCNLSSIRKMFDSPRDLMRKIKYQLASLMR